MVVETIPGKILPYERAEATALVDTGSAGTVIRRDLVEKLGLIEIGVAEITHAAHAQPAPCAYTAAHVVLEGENDGAWTFAERLLIAEHEDMEPGLILGLDCFARGVLTVNQVNGWWSFEAFA